MRYIPSVTSMKTNTNSMEKDTKETSTKTKVAITKIERKKGDPITSTVDGDKAILHICSDRYHKRWKDKFSKLISKRCPDAEEWYKLWSSGEVKDVRFSLGKIQSIRVENNLIIFNMVAQHGIENNRDGRSPARYEELEACLDKVVKYLQKQDGSWTVTCQKIKAGLYGWDWDMIEKLLEKKLCLNGFKVIVYSEQK